MFVVRSFWTEQSRCGSCSSGSLVVAVVAVVVVAVVAVLVVAEQSVLRNIVAICPSKQSLE